MRSKLLSSFIFVTFFWWLVTTLRWSLADPETNLKSLQALSHMLPFLHVPVPQGHVNILDALAMQKTVFLYWTLPIWGAVALCAIAGLGVVWYRAMQEKKERDARENSTDNFRGITISLGALPQPMKIKHDVLEMGTSNSDVLGTLTEKEKSLLLDIMGILSAHPNAYAGQGHAISLVDMAMGSVELALSHKTRPGLAAVVAAASELGKITAYKKDGNGEWLRTKDVCRESTTSLATLTSWWELPVEDRAAVMFAVRYRDNPDTLIDASGNRAVLSLAKSLLYKAAAAVEKASVDERERVLSKQELPDLAFKVFMDNLSQLGFQDGLPKGVKAVGWKIGGRVYLIEIMLRERLMAKLPEDVRGALMANASAKKGLHPFTIDLMKSLNAKGWLVKEVNGVKVTAREALWTIQAGKLVIKGVIILDIPDEHREMLPSKDSLYAVSVMGPLFSNAGSVAISSNDVAGLGLFSNGEGKQTPSKKPAEAPKGLSGGSPQPAPAHASPPRAPAQPPAAQGQATTAPSPRPPQNGPTKVAQVAPPKAAPPAADEENPFE